MAALIKGIPVTLYQRAQTGTDAFGAPTYTETPVTVENVLAAPVAAEAVVNGQQLSGRRLVYELCIPKVDSHSWEGCRVEFFGQTFRAFGPVTEYIDAMTPLDWNRKVKVERYE